MQLAGSTALVTGASGGIGRHLVAALARRGVDLAISGRDAGRLEEAAAQARGHGARAEVLPADLADPDAAEALVARAEAAVGPLDVLVNNAGIETIGAYTAHSRA